MILSKQALVLTVLTININNNNNNIIIKSYRVSIMFLSSYSSDLVMYNLNVFLVFYHLNISLACCVTRMNVARLLISFNFCAPTYVHADRIPPRISSIVALTSPRCSSSIHLPSDALYEECHYISITLQA